MKKVILSTAICSMLCFISCTTQSNSKEQTKRLDSTKNEPLMDNLVSIVEIPTTDFARAVSFYKIVLNIDIEEVKMEGIQMGVLPSDGKTVSLILVKGPDYKPTTSGAIVYLNAGSDLQPTLDKVAKNGGKVLVPKTQISPEMGFFALFIDTEGNKLGLHSSN